MTIRTSAVRLWPIAIALVPLLLAVVPLFFIGHGGLATDTFETDKDFFVAAARSFAIALAASTLGLWFFVMATAARRNDARTLTAYDFVLLAPLLVGEGAIGFAVKEIITFYFPQGGGSALSSVLFYYGLLVTIYAIVLGQFLYVAISLSQRADMARLLPYARTHRMTSVESMSLIESPSWAPGLQLYLLLAVIIVAYQSAVSQYGFKPGPGQMNELWPHVLSRWVRAMSAIDLRSAVELTGIAAIIVTLCSVAFLLFALPFNRAAMRSELRLMRHLPMVSMRLTSLLLRGCALALLVAIAFVGISGAISRPDMNAWLGQALSGGILETLILTALTAFLLCLIATALVTPLHRHQSRAGESPALWPVVIPLIAGLLVPRIAVGNGALALKLMLFADNDSPWLIPTAWVAAHIAANLPLATAYLLITFARLRPQAWRYYQTYGMSNVEMVRQVLWPMFRGDYLFLYLFLGLIIWTDYPIGRVFSEAVPSLPILLDAASESRAASSGFAASLLLLTTGLSTALLWLFGARILRTTKS